MRHLLSTCLIFACALASFVTLAACPSAVTDCTTPGKATSSECTVVNAVVDCAHAQGDPAIAQEVLTDIQTKNWADIELVAVKYGGCVVAEVVQKYLAGRASAQIAIRAGEPTVDEVKTQFAILRNKHFAGHQFTTTGGTL